MSLYVMQFMVKARVEPLYEAAETYRLAEVAQGREFEAAGIEDVQTELELEHWEHLHEPSRRRAPRLVLKNAHR